MNARLFDRLDPGIELEKDHVADSSGVTRLTYRARRHP
jgi:hypothetical protein